MELGRLLTAELKREGSNVVPVEEADYLMAYTLEDELVPQPRSITITEPASPPQTPGQVMSQTDGSYANDPTIPMRGASEPILFRNRGIRLFL